MFFIGFVNDICKPCWMTKFIRVVVVDPEARV